MSTKRRLLRRPFAVMLASSLSAATLLHAQEADTAGGDNLAALNELALRGRSTPNVTVALVKRLVARGVLPKEEGDELLLEAEADAAEAHAQAALTQAALAQAAAAQARLRVLTSRNLHRVGASSTADRSAAGALPGPADETTDAVEESAPPVVRRSPAQRRAPVTIPPPEEEVAASTPAPGERPAPRVHTRTKTAPAPEPEIAGTSSEDLSPEPAPRASRPSHAAPAPKEETLDDDEVRVAYVPESVKSELREEIKHDVMDQARRENWAAPRMLPEWVTRFRFFGDFRMRGEGLLLPTGNATGAGSAFWNYNAINTSSTPFDYTALANPPISNVDQDRHRLRLRARLGAEADLAEGFSVGTRIGTGENNSPVTQNQTLGAASGQGGNFSKYALWIDRAFLKYELWGAPDKDLTIQAGRFDNPFFSTSMIWADDLGFDGLVGKWKFSAGDAATPFITAGAFPVYNTDLNFGATNSTKFKSQDKWLVAAQVGTDLEVSSDVNFKIGVAYYGFQNVEGKVSTQFTPVTAQDPGDTDATRPAFAQRGNTYIALRDIALDANNSGANGVTNQWQYFGLATPFHELALTAQLDFNQFQPLQISLFGEVVKNLAFDPLKISQNGPARLKGAINNNATDGATFGGKGTAWTAGVRVGDAALEKRWDWNVSLAYRNVGSDAVVDGFADSDFGGGGTNVKGFIFSSSLSLAKHVWLSARWMSATQLAGPVYKADTVQFDINGKF